MGVDFFFSNTMLKNCIPQNRKIYVASSAEEAELLENMLTKQDINK